MKLRWMLDHHKNVREAHDSDDLMFGTVDSWLVYVGPVSLWPTNADTLRTSLEGWTVAST